MRHAHTTGVLGAGMSGKTMNFLDCLDGRAVLAMPVERAAKHPAIVFQILEIR